SYEPLRVALHLSRVDGPKVIGPSYESLRVDPRDASRRHVNLWDASRHVDLRDASWDADLRDAYRRQLAFGMLVGTVIFGTLVVGTLTFGMLVGTLTFGTLTLGTFKPPALARSAPTTTAQRATETLTSFVALILSLLWPRSCLVKCCQCYPLA